MSQPLHPPSWAHVIGSPLEQKSEPQKPESDGASDDDDDNYGDNYSDSDDYDGYVIHTGWGHNPQHVAEWIEWLNYAKDPLHKDRF